MVKFTVGAGFVTFAVAGVVLRRVMRGLERNWFPHPQNVSRIKYKKPELIGWFFRTTNTGVLFDANLLDTLSPTNYVYLCKYTLRTSYTFIEKF